MPNALFKNRNFLKEAETEDRDLSGPSQCLLWIFRGEANLGVLPALKFLGPHHILFIYAPNKYYCIHTLCQASNQELGLTTNETN